MADTHVERLRGNGRRVWGALISLAFLIGAGITWINALPVDGEASAQGTVIKSLARDETRMRCVGARRRTRCVRQEAVTENLTSAEIEFVDQRGNKYSFVEDERGFRVGSHVAVRYNIDHPSEARTHGATYRTAITLGALGLAGMALTAASGVRARRKRLRTTAAVIDAQRRQELTTRWY